MKTIYYLIGLPCSGKSHYYSQYLSDCTLISNDVIIEEWAAKNGVNYNDAWGKVSFAWVTEECRRRFDLAISQHKSICIDNTNMTPKARRKYRTNAGYDLKAVVFDIPEKLRLERTLKRKNETGKEVPEAAVENMKNIFRMPTKEEGFVDIKIVKG